MAGGDFLDMVEVVFFVIINHHVETDEGLEQVLFDASSPTPYPFDDIRTHTQLPRKDLHHYRGLGVGGGVEHETRGRKDHLLLKDKS